MLSFRAFIGLLVLLISSTCQAFEFLCPVPANIQNLSCEGAVRVKSLSDLLVYRSDRGLKNGKLKNLIIDFPVTSSSLSISTPCQITVAKSNSININGSLCLHGDRGVVFDESINLHSL